MAFLVDTNVLVYRYDARFPDKQARARDLMREGLASDEARIAHQAVVELVAATTRPIAPDSASLLTLDEARREAEELLATFRVVYPNDSVVRTAIRGSATYQLSWFDAQMWACAEHYGLATLYSEDFQHGRLYGTVRVENPFR